MKKYFPFFLAFLLAFATITPSFASAKEEGEIDAPTGSLESELLSPGSDFVKFLEGIEQLPASVEKQGPEKVASWLTEKTGVEVTTNGDNLVVPSLSDVDVKESKTSADSSAIQPAGAWDCVIAVGLMIGTVGFPLSKIVKLKKAINLLGGVKKTVDRIYSKYKSLKKQRWRTVDAWKEAVKRTTNNLPKDVGEAFLDFFNISNVIRQCV